MQAVTQNQSSGSIGVGRAPALDFGRFIAAVSVLAFPWLYLDPLAGRVPWTSVLGPLAMYGYLGVEYFFILSGFVICCSAEGGSRLQFMRNRVARLLPAFFICAVLTSVSLGIAGQPVSVGRFIANMTFQANALGFDWIDPVYWSLAAETLFYAAVFVFVIGDKMHHKLRIATILWLLLSTIELRGAPYVLLNLQWAPYFSVGIAWFLWLSEKRKVDLVLFFLSVTLATFAAYEGAARVGAYLSYQPSALVSAMLVLGLSVSLPGLAAIRSMGNMRVALSLGALSYPLYLLHYEFMRPILMKSWQEGVASVVVANLCLFVVAYGVCLIETPGRRLLRGGSQIA